MLWTAIDSVARSLEHLHNILCHEH